MLQVLYPVFEINGEEYVADTRSVLTSNPPQYNAYRLKDKKQTCISCNKAHGNKVMYPHDFHEWMHGKAIVQAYQAGFTNHGIVTNDPSAVVSPVTYPRPETWEEKVEKLENKIKELEAKIERLTVKD